jgi:hypothetical protein
MQTLTTLDLSWNQIGEEGTKCLATLLKKNTVSHNFRSSIPFMLLSLSFNLDADYIESSGKPNRH